MLDDIELTDEERAALDKAAVKVAAKRRRSKRKKQQAAEDERTAPSIPEWVQKAADKHGVDLADDAKPSLTGCDVCDGRQELHEVAFAFVGGLCDEHADAVRKQISERVLRQQLPLEFHDASPKGLRTELQRWTPEVGGLYLYGDVGVGKSHDAAALLKRGWVWWSRTTGRMPSVVWRNVAEMMDDIGATFNRDVPEYDLSAVRGADIAVLDDMGTADNMPFAVRKLYIVVEHRMHHGLCTIVTSNKALDSLARHLNSPQIASRLSMMCAQVSYEGLPDRRPELAPRLE